MFILDSHCDTPSQIVRLRDLSIDNPHAHVDFPKLLRGGVSASFFALFTSAAREGDDATTYCLNMLAKLYDSLDENSDKAKLADSTSQIKENYKKNLLSILIGMENGSPIQNSLPLLRLFYRMGVRYMTLTHNADNLICDSAAEGKTWGGLSPFGKEVVAEMNRLGMIIDLAHCSDDTFYDCIKYSKAPIVSTHSCCRTLASHKRNMTDHMLKTLAENQGVIQINFYPAFLSDDFNKVLDESGFADEADEIEAEFIADPGNQGKLNLWIKAQEKLKTLPRPGVKEVVDHIDHAVKIMGINHVGIGSDFDGIIVPPKGLEDVSMINSIFDEMKNRGYKKDEIEKVAGLNFLRVFEKVEEIAHNSQN